MTLRVNTKPRHKNSPRIAEKSAPGFLQWLRGRACVFHFLGPCEGKVEAMHLDFAGDKGMATKVSDRYALPACAKHHRSQHEMGWLTFMTVAKLNRNMLMDAAQRLWNSWPGRPAWERKLSDG